MLHGCVRYLASVSNSVQDAVTGSTPWYATSLAGVVYGAVIALIGSVFVQGWLVPRIEARKRREQRWEADLRDLGETLSSEGLSRAANAARFAADLFLTLRWGTVDAEIGEEELASMLQEATTNALNAQREYEQLAVTRLRWLVSRVVSLSPDSDALRLLKVRAEAYLDASMHTHEWQFERGLTSQGNYALWDAEQESRDALTRSVITLMDAKRLPHTPWYRRLAYWWRRSVARPVSAWWTSY